MSVPSFFSTEYRILAFFEENRAASADIMAIYKSPAFSRISFDAFQDAIFRARDKGLVTLQHGGENVTVEVTAEGLAFPERYRESVAVLMDEPLKDVFLAKPAKKSSPSFSSGFAKGESADQPEYLPPSMKFHHFLRCFGVIASLVVSAFRLLPPVFWNLIPFAENAPVANPGMPAPSFLAFTLLFFCLQSVSAMEFVIHAKRMLPESLSAIRYYAVFNVLTAIAAEMTTYHTASTELFPASVSIAGIWSLVVFVYYADKARKQVFSSGSDKGRR